MLETFFKNNNLQNPEDIDSLLELATIVRQLISSEQYSEINSLVKYIIMHDYYEAFSWTMEILQEDFEKEDGLKDFECFVGNSISNYDEFIQRLQVDFHVLDNDYETVHDETGEVQSFFNIFKYKTRFENIYLVSSENFDTKDNDYIQYKLLFTRR